MKYKLFITSLLLSSLPAMAYGFTLGGTLTDVISYVVDILNIVTPILWAGAFIIFFWGLSKFIMNAGSEAENKKGKDYMLWGILILFILVSYRAIISLVSGELGFGNAKSYPFLPENGNVESKTVKITFPDINP